jgi:hypothetical protein
MASLFPRWTNTLSRIMGAATLIIPAVGVGGALLIVRTPFITNEHVEIDQPVQFDHRHHNWEQGIDCRYCHSAVETSANAGIPATSVCLGCHAQVWNKSPRLEPLRQAFFTEKPLQWNKVHDLPDFVYFNHSIHVGKGVGCVSCHGRVDQMATMRQEAPLTMQWCVECHRDPSKHIRPVDQVTNMTWKPATVGGHGAVGHGGGENASENEHTKTERSGATPTSAGPDNWAEKNAVHPRTSCDTCHR